MQIRKVGVPEKLWAQPVNFTGKAWPLDCVDIDETWVAIVPPPKL